MQDQNFDAKAVSFCPSFDSYSTDNQLADIAARVSEEQEKDDDASALLKNRNDNNDDDDDDDGDDFEFVLLRKNPNDDDDDDASKMYSTGDQDDHQGHLYPIFNRDLLLLDDFDEDSVEDSIRLPLKNLFIDTRQDSLSSSSEGGELEGVPSGTYCLWTPKSPSPSSLPSPGRCKKSNSTGSSSTSTSSKQKRWRLRDLLRRCKSIDGKESLVFLRNPAKQPINPKAQASGFLTSPNHGGNNLEHNNKIKKAEEIKGKSGVSTVKITKSKEKMVSAHEVFYVRSKSMMKGENKRKSYLPYRPDLVGFFANVNGLGRSFTPF